MISADFRNPKLSDAAQTPTATVAEQRHEARAGGGSEVWRWGMDSMGENDIYIGHQDSGCPGLRGAEY